MKFLIQADTYRKAAACADMYNLQPHDWVFLDTVEKMMGLSRDECVIWRYNGWIHHKDAKQFYDQAIVRGLQVFDKEERFTGDYDKHAYAHAKSIMSETR